MYRINTTIRDNTPLITMVVLFGTIAAGGSYFLSFHTAIEANNHLITRQYEELTSQRGEIIQDRKANQERFDRILVVGTEAASTLGQLEKRLEEIGTRVGRIEDRLLSSE